MAVMDMRDTILELCNGNEDATRLIMGFWSLCEVWDDAIDGEKNETDADIHQAFMWALFGLNDNEFYVRHRAALRPAMMTCIANWMAANTLEKCTSDDALNTAYVLRCSPYDFFVTVVLLAGGMDASVRAAELFRSMPTSDNLDAYKASITNRRVSA